MKAPNKHITRLLSWTLSGSVLTSSCTNTGPEIDSATPISEKLSDIGSAAISVPLTIEQRKYLHFLGKLANDIIENPQVAREFSQDYKGYVSRRGFADQSDSIIIDEGLQRVIAALGDDDINSAIRNGEVKQYLLLMYEKGYIDFSLNDYNSFLTEEQKKQVLESLGVSSEEFDQKVLAVAAFLTVFYAVAAIISYVGVMYTAIATMNAGVAFTIVYSVGAITDVNVKSVSSDELFIENDKFDIWTLKADDAAYSLLDNKTDNVVSEIISAYQEIASKEIGAFDANKLHQTVNLNLLKEEERLLNNQKIR